MALQGAFPAAGLAKGERLGERGGVKSASVSRRSIFSWACFDFANSAFSTLVVTFIFATFFTEGIAADKIEGTRLWGMGVAISSCLIAVLSPPLGAVADAFAWKKRLMLACVGVCAMGSFGLFFPQRGDALLALSLFVAANVAVELSIVFNNGFLRDLAPLEKQGKISGLAWAFGYLGGLLCLAIALVGFVMPEQAWFGLDKERFEHIRATNVLVGVWVLVFSLPMVFWLQESRPAAPAEGVATLARQSFGRLRETFTHVREYRNVFWLLVARMLYNDGLATVFAFGAIYAMGTFGFAFSEVLVFGIVLNVCSGVGAFLFSFVEDRIGSRTTIVISLVFLAVSSVAALLVTTQAGFWACAVGLGLFIGPNQSASRAFMSRISPPEKVGEFFGFFAFSGKATAFFGPLLCGQLAGWFDSQRAGMSVVPLLLVSGMILLLWKTRSESGAAEG